MNRSAITIENLGKRYTIGHQRANGDGMRHAIEDAIRNPRGVASFRPTKETRTAGYLGAKRCFSPDQ